MRIELLDPATATEQDVDGLHAVQVAAAAADRPGASNTHMLRINERLGFREHWAILGFQGEVAALADRLGGRRPC